MNNISFQPAHRSHLTHLDKLIREAVRFQRDMQPLQVTIASIVIRSHVELMRETDYPIEEVEGMLFELMNQFKQCLPFFGDSSILLIMNELSALIIHLSSRIANKTGKCLMDGFAELTEELLGAARKSGFLQAVLELPLISKVKADDALVRLIDFLALHYEDK